MEDISPVPVSSSDVTMDNIISNYEPYQPIQVSLIDEANLWSQFSKLGTEMVITKTGRQMFPGVKLRLENLSPYKFYKVYMELAPVDCVRYRYDKNCWSPRGAPEISVTSSVIEHPQSPAEGFKWMLKPVDFNVRLTNCLENTNGETACLRSMFKYMIIIHVEEGCDMTLRNRQLTRTFPLVKTTFTAVTTYQNSEVKELKTATNIHAKGIRRKKMKQCQEIYKSMKENFSKRNIHVTSDTSKRSRLEYDFSSADLQKSFSTVNDSTSEEISTTTPFLPNFNGFLPTIPDFTGRSDLFTTPVLPKYRRIESPVLTERIPFTTPLTVHCPSPYLQMERPSYCNSLLLPVYHQRFPVFPTVPTSSLYQNNWPIYQNNCRSTTCGSSTFNICPSCREGFQNCVTCTTLPNVPAHNHPLPSTTAESEISSSFESLHTIQPTLLLNSDSADSSSSGDNTSKSSSETDTVSSSLAEALNQIYS